MTVYRGRWGAKRGTPTPRGRTPWLIAGGAIVLILCVLAAGALIVSGSRTTISSAPGALARIGLPLGGGSVTRVVATTGNHQKPVRVVVKGDPVVYPGVKIPAGEKLTITATVRRPGWISWLTGHAQQVTRTVTVPAATVHDRFVTLTRSGVLKVRFSKPVRTISYGATAATVRRHTLARAQQTVTLPHVTTAGTMYVAATVQRWETSPAEIMNWFPSGTQATAVAAPSSGATIHSDTPITLTFSKPVSAVVGSHLPTVTPAGAGHWHRISSHAIRLVPTGYGYGLGQKVTVDLPTGVRIAGAGAVPHSSASTAIWNVPAGSTIRLQQLLAQLGYLPFKVSYAAAAPADTLAAQEIAAEAPPAATLNWAYANTPAGLRAEWNGVATAGVMTQGAMMRFQTDHGLQVTGYEDSETWNALFQAVIKHQRNTFGYTFVSSTETSPEHLFVWHSGQMVLSDILDNSGVPGAATATGTYPVFEHAPSVTMIGTNVDGSHYDDPNIKWVSYFNGGDALHYYPRGSYGSPQSNGCLEMSEPDAAKVYPFTPVGTLVQVTS